MNIHEKIEATALEIKDELLSKYARKWTQSVVLDLSKKYSKDIIRDMGDQWEDKLSPLKGEFLHTRPNIALVKKLNQTVLRALSSKGVISSSKAYNTPTSRLTPHHERNPFVGPRRTKENRHAQRSSQSRFARPKTSYDLSKELPSIINEVKATLNNQSTVQPSKIINQASFRLSKMFGIAEQTMKAYPEEWKIASNSKQHSSNLRVCSLVLSKVITKKING